ncbi:hypothetical protein [Neorhizobium sp. JUb45]|uniref:hypothetical protein n=1 Tax=unclassified Neorhizobium TaxID=2629175 RepID=UPI00104786D5|nr:hypothetical protein [Neorhizobium sp. JUb45]TCR02030.1 hypothetical protein EDF70_104307 [Neorhizobium sp. JUb45]
MSRFAHGDVILYSYLWAREYDRGEESGRKARPTCVMLIVISQDGRKKSLLFPITSQPPRLNRWAIEIPPAEARTANLRMPAWVIVDEFNTDDLVASFAVEKQSPLGHFSKMFMSKIAVTAAQAMRAASARNIPRDPVTG